MNLRNAFAAWRGPDHFDPDFAHSSARVQAAVENASSDWNRHTTWTRPSRIEAARRGRSPTITISLLPPAPRAIEPPAARQSAGLPLGYAS